MEEDDPDYEYTIFQCREVQVFQIPPASSSAGHKADDWKKCIWRGRCRTVGKGKDMLIKLLDNTNGNLFAQCTIPGGDHGKYVEAVTDSSRYFVLKVTNGDRHAFIGLGFEDRNESFDFKCALTDFKPGGNKEPEPAAPSPGLGRDLSLKEGQKIQIKLKGKSADSGDKPKTGGSLTGLGPPPSGSGGFGILAPPPAAGGSRRPADAMADPFAAPAAAPAVAAAPAAAPATSAAADDFFGDFDDFQSAFQSAPATGSTAAVTTSAAMPQASPALSTGSVNGGLSDQFAAMSFGSPTPAAAPAPAATFADPFAAPAKAAAPSPAPAQASAGGGGFDMFSFNGLGNAAAPAPAAGGGYGGASTQPAAAPMPFVQPGPAKPAGGGSKDPFDDFDMFK
eukprot:TRINITY_DN32511_c0_g1_i1.p1 TRINITY_DN32511_c0_g1~~TRINITY_DN32511_c0_g1_i1.p1  ORF type:complete len:394 (-),score=119.24 TRINITY_DN32511_c0_g1_i1:71-1252(-)